MSSKMHLVSLYLICSLSVVLSIANFVEEKKILRGMHFRLPATLSKPMLWRTMGSDGNVTYYGTDKEFADWVAASFKITYNYVEMDNASIAKVGYYRTLFDMFLNKSVDIVSAPITPSPSRKAIMDFSYPLLIKDYKIASPWPVEESRLLAPLWPFQKWVWIGLIFSTVATLLFFTISSYLDSDPSRLESKKTWRDFLGGNVLLLLAVTLGQGDAYRWRKGSVRIAAAGWCLLIVVVVNTYAGTLASFLSLPVYKKSINSLEDLAERTDVSLVIGSDTVQLQAFLEAQSGTYKVIGDSLRAHPENIVKTVSQLVEKMFSGKHAYFDIGTYIEFLIGSDYKSHKTCSLSISKSLPVYDLLTYGLPKDGPYNRIINYQILLMWEYGLREGWFRPYKLPYEQCIIKKQKVAMHAMKVNDLHSAFILLAIGISLAFLVFLCELAYKRFKPFAL